MYEIIVNPNSKCGKGRHVWKLVQQYLEKSHIVYHVSFSEFAGHARTLAASIVFPKDVPVSERVVVIIGGDGTLNEVVNGLKNLHSLIIGYIPAGSGNDFARNLHIPKNVRRACKVIFEKKRIRQLDYGVNCVGRDEVRNRRFLVSSGIGYDAAICHDMNHASWKKTLNKIHLGKLAYAACGLRQIIYSQPIDGELILDGVKRVRLHGIYFLSCHILETEGGGFLFGKKADPEDGLLNICVFQNMEKKQFVEALIFTLLGGHQNRVSGVRNYVCQEAKIATREPMAVHTDGESCQVQTEMSVSCVQSGLNVYC
ncbi:MAG: diacylglycerol kinase family lipid kinase [Lachnospiraceae bacterium]|nr:diacylglycerol kinase family lipid kinase [Lachnospiraceae bacterium]